MIMNEATSVESCDGESTAAQSHEDQLQDASMSRDHSARPDFESIKIVLLALLDRIDALETDVRERPLSQLDLRDEVSQFEGALIKAALASTNGRQRRAARALGMKASTLNAKIQRYHFTTSSNSQSEAS